MTNDLLSMEKTNIEAENARLISELSESKRHNSESKKQIKKLSQKLEKKNSKISNLQKELKKNDGWSLT